MNNFNNTENLGSENPAKPSVSTIKRITDKFAGLSMLITATFGTLPAAANPVDNPRSRGNSSLIEISSLYENGVYIVLFENNNKNNRDANLIETAEKHAYPTIAQPPYHWHVEILYHNNSQWMMAGCRPPICGSVPVKEVTSSYHYQGNTLRALRLKGATESDVKTIMNEYNGTSYSLTRTDGANCTDPAAALVKRVTGKGIPEISRYEAENNTQIQSWLGDNFEMIWAKPEDGGRNTLMFPGSFENIGSFLAKVAWTVTREMAKEHIQKTIQLANSNDGAE